jgi:aspartyl-tRNA(Asn)/glutamyl-tRNA(Gln) amidotransferase subunit C
MIDAATVDAIAALARLELSPGERDKLCSDLGRITGYIDKIAQAGIDIAHHDHLAIPVENVWREDEAVSRDGSKQQQFLANAPLAEAEYLRVPKIVE